MFPMAAYNKSQLNHLPEGKSIDEVVDSVLLRRIAEALPGIQARPDDARRALDLFKRYHPNPTDWALVEDNYKLVRAVGFKERRELDYAAEFLLTRVLRTDFSQYTQEYDKGRTSEQEAARR